MTRLHHSLKPIPCKPWALNGLSERLIVGHYESEYGPAVRSLNAIRDELQSFDLSSLPDHRIRAIKGAELAAMASVLLHELYFGALGGDGAAVFTGSGRGSTMEASIARLLDQQFGSVAAWKREFVALANALGHGSGWALLMYSCRDGRLYNQLALDHSQALIDAVPLLALDMYEHAYHLDFGANAAAYVDAFMRNVDWSVVSARLLEASGVGARTLTDDPDTLPSISVEELSDETIRKRIQILDARPKHYFSRSTDMMPGAVWRDPDRIDEWSQELSAEVPVVVYCAYGYSVGCGVTAALRDRGFDAKYVRGGLAAWYAADGARAMKPRDDV